MKRDDKSVEVFLRASVHFLTAPLTKQEVHELLKPFKLLEIHQSIDQETNLQDVPDGHIEQKSEPVQTQTE